MPTGLLMLGVMTAILQNTAYALPAKRVHITSSAALEYSLDGSTWVALTGANTLGVETSATFIRCPASTANVMVKGA